MIEYFCSKCDSKIKPTYSLGKLPIGKHATRLVNDYEIPSGKCPKCKTVFENLDDEIYEHTVHYRDNIRHCPNCGKGFKTNYGPREAGGPGYDLQKHTCPRCRWVIGWQQTFSHGEYVVAMESEELYDQRNHFWSQLRKYGRPDAEGDGEYSG
jgi:uncharacterized C2H2 Zn-finger protein